MLLLPIADTGDHLYSNETGYRMVPEKIDLTLFTGDVNTSAGQKSGNRTDTFSLLQNYPNPFNPTTVIGYQFLVNGWVTLKVYDLLGKEITTLVDEFKEQSTYNCELQIESARVGGEFTSGVYFYRISTDSFFQNTKNVIAQIIS